MAFLKICRSAHIYNYIQTQVISQQLCTNYNPKSERFYFISCSINFILVFFVVIVVDVVCFVFFPEFKSIIAFRQQHRLTNYYDLSDLYFICRLHPLSFEIRPCQDEIRKCQWMDLDELAISSEATPLSHRVAQLLIRARKRGYETIDISMEEWPLTFPGYALTKSYKLFLRTESQH